MFICRVFRFPFFPTTLSFVSIRNNYEKLRNKRQVFTILPQAKREKKNWSWFFDNRLFCLVSSLTESFSKNITSKSWRKNMSLNGAWLLYYFLFVCWWSFLFFFLWYICTGIIILIIPFSPLTPKIFHRSILQQRKSTIRYHINIPFFY